MGVQTDRAAIAAALSTVADITGYQYRPRTPKPGDAWPTLPTLARDQGLLWRPEWTVIVFLPQDERTASEWLDSHALPVIAALESQTPLYPETAEPAVMQTSAGDQFVLEITGRSH